MRKAFQLKQNAELSAIFTPEQLTVDSSQIRLGSQAVIATNILPKGISSTGVIMDRDSVPSLLSVFEGLIPQQNAISKVIPVDAKQARAITFDDVNILSENLKRFHGDSLDIPPFFDAIVEIGSLTAQNGSTFLVRSIDPKLPKRNLTAIVMNLPISGSKAFSIHQ